MSSLSDSTSNQPMSDLISCIGDEYLAEENRYMTAWYTCLCLTIITTIFRYTCIKEWISPPCGLREKKILKISAFSFFLTGFIKIGLAVCLLTILNPACPTSCSPNSCEEIKHKPFGAIIFLLVALSGVWHSKDRLDLANSLPDDDGAFDGVAMTETMGIFNNREDALQAIKEDPKRDNRQIVMNAVTQDGRALQFASERLKRDIYVVLRAVESKGLALQYAHADLQNHKEVVLTAVRNHSGAFFWASKSLKSDKDFVIKAIKLHPSSVLYASRDVKEERAVMEAIGHSLQYASPQDQNNREVVLLAVRSNGLALRFASQRLKDDKSLALAAIRAPSSCVRPVLQYTSTRLRNDKSVVLEAVKQNGMAIQYASEQLREDTEVVLAAVEQDGECLKFLSATIRSNKITVIAAATSKPESLKYALGGLNQDRDCLIAAGLWDNNYDDINNTRSVKMARQDQNATKRAKKIVLSTRFSLSEESSKTATQFTVLLKKHEYISTKFVVYSPNAYSKQTCDPEWTRYDWGCRGTPDTCQMEDQLKMGPPTDSSCWRYSFRHQLDEAKRSNGFMLQVVELRRIAMNESNEWLHVPGPGQIIESEMAQQAGVKVFRIYQPRKYLYRLRDHVREAVFDPDDVEKLVGCIKDWYLGTCSDMSEVEVRCPMRPR